MVLALSELLERIRPAGAPGAPTEGERQRDEADRRAELAVVAEVIATFVAEADAIVESARSESDAIRGEADRRVERLRQQLPDRIARAEALTMTTHDQRLGDERAVVLEQARREIERIDAAAAENTPRLVEKALETIWSMALTPLPGDERRGS